MGGTSRTALFTAVALMSLVSASPATADHYDGSWCRDDESLSECIGRLAGECAALQPQCVVVEAVLDCERAIHGAGRDHCPVPVD